MTAPGIIRQVDSLALVISSTIKAKLKIDLAGVAKLAQYPAM
ncbi:hypothetical protein HNQ95_004646 [Aminobacter ciceronei]|uniref:Uncharacterized protein n=1 Tax=Aminobacter ciceronei TaxID=150723 RepID=A0ABR6CCB8_9HYPH|nr:hypothetical protein [Aminobacter ciceronei]MBA9022669.1 hypothetical protein [Aminobacter ciceronei]